MAESTGLSASDIALMTKDNDTFGDSFAWIVMLLIVAGIFNGNVFGGNNGVTEEYIANEFTQRDIAGVNQNLFNGFNSTNERISNTRYDLGTQINDVKYSEAINSGNTQKEILANRYEGSLAYAGLQKDILLGNQNITSHMDSCCCELKSLVRDEVQEVKDLINNNTIQSLRDQLNLAEMAAANGTQTQNILNTMGTWRANPSYSSCNCGCGCSSSVI